MPGPLPVLKVCYVAFGKSPTSDQMGSVLRVLWMSPSSWTGPISYAMRRSLNVEYSRRG